MSKIDRMAAYEAPRISHLGRPTIEVTLIWRGCKARGTNKTHHQLPKMDHMPELVRYHGRIFKRQSDAQYTEASIWPIIDELDGC